MKLDATTNLLQAHENNVCDLVVTMGEERKALYRNLSPFDVNIFDTIGKIFARYPVELVEIEIFRPNGSSRSKKNTIPLHKTDITMGQSPQTQQHSLFGIPGNGSQPNPNPFLGEMPPLAAYMISDLQRQLSDKDTLLNDFRDKGRIDQDSIRELKEQVSNLKFELRHKDKEHELSTRASELEGKGALDGIAEKLQGLPEPVLMAGMSMIERLFSGGQGQLQQPQLTGYQASNLSPEKQEMVSNIAEMFSTMPAPVCHKVYQVLVYMAQSPANLESIYAQTHHA